MTRPPERCAWCGEVFEARSDGDRTQRFCSTACRRSRRRRPALGGCRSRRRPIAPGSAQERPKELQRFGDEVHAIAAEIGIAMHPNKSGAVAVSSGARHSRERCASPLCVGESQ
jgi:hypothetical protein